MVIKPIRLRNSLYLLVPCEVAKVTDITENTRFVLQLIHSRQTILKFEKINDYSEEKENHGLKAMKALSSPQQS